jgi:hypothetical protein
MDEPRPKTRTLQDAASVGRRAEAEPHAGRRVLVSARNSAQPVEGILVHVTDDGVLVDQGGAHIAVGYRRMSAIEVERA